MKILKFGGTALSVPQGFHALVERVHEIRHLGASGSSSIQGHSCLVVVSALEGVTNQLLSLARLAAAGDPAYEDVLVSLRRTHEGFIQAHLGAAEAAVVRAPAEHYLETQLDLLRSVALGLSLVRDISSKTIDFMLSFGELLSARLVGSALGAHFPNVEVIDSRKLITTNSNFGNASVILELTTPAVRSGFPDDGVVRVVTGFLAATPGGETTTLGRGGSDYTASLLAALLGVPDVELWTTVDGIMTADPKRVSRAFTVPTLTYDEALEMCHFGAKVVYPLALQPAAEHGIRIRIKNALRPSAPGTLISDTVPVSGRSITGISSISKIALFQLHGSGLIGVTGTASRLFDALSREEINVILISQASSETSICFAIPPEHAAHAKHAVEEEFAFERVAHQVELDELGADYSIVASVGSSMRHSRGIAGRLFQALGKNGINVVAIAQGSSELNISVVIESHDEAKALNALHDSFFLSDEKTVNLFLLGTGLVGRALLAQIGAQRENLRTRHIRFELVGAANSRKMLLRPEGIASEQCLEQLASSGEPSDAHAFVQQMLALNLPNSIFVDCTASDTIASLYGTILGNSISIVTPNKRANSGRFAQYEELRRQAIKGNVKFFYETNVGAGLPVIGTLNDLLLSGDEIIRIDAILSGTLSYIFNSYRVGRQFSEIVREAKARGYTEPDPRDDLSGKDVARKLLILAREIGLPLEEEHISVESLVPESCRSAADVDEFFTRLESEDESAESRRRTAEENGEVLRYIATVDRTSARVSLQSVPLSHPFANLSGSDNVISFTTRRYADRPLVVQGPGAGTEVTAAGVLADIVRVASYL